MGSGAARAQDPVSGPRANATVLGGVFDLADGAGRTAELGVQYRFGAHWWRLHPVAGGTLVSAGAVHLYAGVALDLPLGRQAHIRGTLAPGLYFHGSEAKDLGHAVEFRSGIEIGWRSASGWRVGLEFYHLSNGRLGETNPGSNSLVVTVSIPVGSARRNP